jgi:hypothetical protein
VPVPNKHDGEGYLTIMEQKKGIVMYGCWHLILQVASKCDPRGTLIKEDGTPHTAESIARKTGWRQASDVQMTLDFCSSPQVGWIEEVTPETSGGRQAGVSTLSPNGTEPNRMEPKGIERIEPNRTEGDLGSEILNSLSGQVLVSGHRIGFKQVKYTPYEALCHACTGRKSTRVSAKDVVDAIASMDPTVALMLCDEVNAIRERDNRKAEYMVGVMRTKIKEMTK